MFISTSNAIIVLDRGSNGTEVYFIAELEVHKIWREIVKILLRGFSYCKLFHAFESLRQIEFQKTKLFLAWKEMMSWYLLASSTA